MEKLEKLIYSILVAAVVCMVAGRLLLPLLRRLKFGQSEREEGPQSHLKKAGTLTMGGIMIIIGVVAGTLPFSMDALHYSLPALLVTISYGLVGFLDDFIKIKYKNTKGLRAYQKIIAQFAIALVIAIYCKENIGTVIELPFFNAEFDLGMFYIPFAIFLIVGTVNSVNLIDGVDGLTSGVTLIYAFVMGIIFVYLSETSAAAGSVMESADYSAMTAFAGAVVGGCMGFLRYNAYPAKVFMGDTGSLALGGAVAMMALYSRAVLLLPIMGGCYVATAISVILQVGSYKLRKKRIFKMAPLHHHFELMNISETKIVAGYMIVTAILCLVCLLAYV